MKLIKIILILIILNTSNSFSENFDKFNQWKLKFKQVALANNISETTIDKAISNIKFLPKVIEYDRFQPEFYEDTKTYIEKRTSIKKLNKGLSFYQKNMNLIINTEKEFIIEKELLISLMGIETNFGTYVGKMDILSSLATLSFDKIRTEFFKN